MVALKAQPNGSFWAVSQLFFPCLSRFKHVINASTPPPPLLHFSFGMINPFQNVLGSRYLKERLVLPHPSFALCSAEETLLCVPLVGEV